MTSALRIGIDATKLQGHPDGIASYSRELCMALVDAASTGTRFLYYGLPDAASRARFRDAHPALAAAGAVMKASGPGPGEVDVYHGLSGHVPERFAGPLVFTCYDMTVLTHAHLHTVENRLSWMEGTLRALLGDAVFVAISHSTAEQLTAELGVDKQRIRVIHPAPGRAFRRLPAGEAAARVRERFGLGGGYLLNVGTLEPRKNLRRLLEAYAGLDAATREALPLVIVGADGWRHDDTDRYLREHPFLRAHVRRLEHVDQEDLVALYNAATVFAYPSLAEGFGLPVAEALACGAPVVTSNATALPEVAGEAALYCDPMDVDALREAIARLFHAGDERERLRRLGPVQAGRFSWARAARETLALYEALAG